MTSEAPTPMPTLPALRLPIPVTQEGWDTRLSLDTACAECRGSGCVDCAHLGRIPTDAGLAILGLVLRYGHAFGIEVVR